MPSFGGNPGNRALPPPPAPRSAGAPPSHTDVTSGGGYGGQQASAFKQTPAYKQAVVSVFKAQPPAQQHAIVQGAQQHATPEGKAVLDFVRQNGQNPFSQEINRLGSQGAIKGSVFGAGSRAGIKTDPSQKPPGGGGLLDTVGDAFGGAVGGLGDAAKFVYNLSNPSRLTQPGLAQSDVTPALHLAQQGVGAVGKAIQAIPTQNTGPGGLPVMQGGVSGGQFAKNLLKDVANLGVEALPSTAIPIEKAVQGHWKEAAQMFTQPYVNAFEHPIQSLQTNPATTSLMAAGIFDPASALVERGVRGVLGKGPVNRTPESVHLTGDLTHERPAFSQFPRVRLMQKSVEKQLYVRHPITRELVPRAEQVRGRLIALETSRLVGQNNRVRAANHQAELKAHADAVLRPAAAQAVHAAATALKYNPGAALIPGHSVLGLIAEGIVRRPQTVVEDLTKVQDMLAQNRPHLEGDPAAIADHNQTVKDVQLALKQAKGGKDFAPAFRAAASYARDYQPTEAAAHGLGHFRDMTPEALQRRTLMGAVNMHMPGARFDPAQGMVRDVPIAGAADRLAQLRAHETRLAGVIRAGSERYPGQIEAAKAGLQRVQQRIATFRTHEPHPLSTREMAQFVARETGGRQLGFVSHELRRSEAQGDAAHYVNQERRPQTARMGDTLYAVTHGLTNPTHEALLHQRVRMRGIVDAHRSMNRLIDQLVAKHPDGGYWRTFQDAARAGRSSGMVPFRISQPFHPAEALTQAMHGVDSATLAEEADRHSLDINSRLAPSSEPGQYGLIHPAASKQLLAHEKMLSPNTFFRTLKGLNTQFRKVALATSFRHLPGVAQESLIRAAMSGIGPVSMLAGRAALERGKQLDPVIGHERQVQLTGGGTVTGSTLALATRQTSRHFENTPLYYPLKAFETAMKAPALRQLGQLWRVWQRFTLGGTKKVLEEQLQVGALGKQVIRDFGGNHGLLAAVMGDWGKMIDQAAHGIQDEATARRLGAGIRRIAGTWTDLTPSAQSALLFSPFGMWWTNSVAWLARMPTDHPIGTAFQAGLNQGTQQERRKYGLDLFQPNSLPLYKQGGIPIAGKIWGANYYSPPGTLNDPAATAASLIEPWWGQMAAALYGKNWLLNTITSPGNPKGRNNPGLLDILTVLGNSAMSSFVPLYQKAQTIVEGGAPKYDTSTLVAPQTKGPNPGPVAGLVKAVTPVRLSKPTSGKASGGSGWNFSAGSSGGSSGGSGWNFSGAAPSSSSGWKFQ